MGRIIPLPVCAFGRATIHVMGDAVDGFEVSHESASGDSWGALIGPFKDGQSAIVAAYALNRDEYAGTCNVAVSDAALQHDGAVVRLSLPGGF
jgi:hypothetical protein